MKSILLKLPVILYLTLILSARAWSTPAEDQGIAVMEYQALAARFNRELAGHFPFAGPNAVDAHPATVASFFADFSQWQKVNQPYLPFMVQSKRVAPFLDQLVKASALFDVSAMAGQAMPRLIEITPTIDRQKSENANQLVSLGLRCGESLWAFPVQSAASVSCPLFGRENGMISVDMFLADMSLWAFDSVLGGQSKAVGGAALANIVSNNQAQFDFAGHWPLFRLMQHRSAKLETPEYQLLQFSVPANLNVSEGNTRAGQVSVMLRISLEYTDPKTQAKLPLLWPELPRFAPSWY